MILTNVDRAFMAALVSFLISLVAAPIVFRFLLRAKSRQIVSEFVPEHAQKQGTPTMGGLIVLIGLIGAFWFVPRGELVTPLVLVAGFALIGFVDDYIVPRMAKGTRGLGWKQKFMMQIAVAAAAYWFGGVTTPGSTRSPPSPTRPARPHRSRACGAGGIPTRRWRRAGT